MNCEGFQTQDIYQLSGRKAIRREATRYKELNNSLLELINKLEQPGERDVVETLEVLNTINELLNTVQLTPPQIKDRSLISAFL